MNARRLKACAPVLLALGAVLGIATLINSNVSADATNFFPPARFVNASHPLPAGILLSQQVNLALDKEGPEEANVLDILTYTLIFTNNTNQTLSGVIITDTWTTKVQKYERGGDPPLAEYNGNYQISGVTVDSFTYTINTARRRGEATWFLGPLNPGVVGTIVFTMGVPDLLQPQGDPVEVGPSTIENSAAITTSPASGISTGADIVVSSIVGPVLELRKSFTTETGLTSGERVGRVVTYTLQLQNRVRADAKPAFGIRISETLPSFLELLTAWSDVPGVITGYDSNSRLISWVFPSDFILQPGETTYVTFSVRIGLDAPINKDIRNDRVNCKAVAANMALPVDCVSNVSLKALAPQYKTAQTASPPTQADKTYPNRPLTYTVYIYNPYQEPVTDGSATDTMPPTFRFVQMIDGPTPTTVATNTVTWTGLSIPANGVISFTFLAHIGPDTPLATNCGENQQYNNVMTTTLNGRSFMDDKMAPIFVVPQLKVSKSVAPGTQNPGEDVVYTITLQNRGDTNISGPIIITDVLPLSFRFVEMVSNPPPGTPMTDENVIWWTNVPGVPVGGTVAFSFKVRVDGKTDESYSNKVFGSSSDTSICPLDTASVKIGTAMRYRKAAIPPAPTPIVQGESFTYVFTQGNSSRVYTYVIDRFIDYLPSGFYAEGSSTYIRSITPPFTLEPDWSNWWEDAFSVTVKGDGAGTTWCDNLGDPGKQTIYQEKSKFGVHTIYPWNGYWWNVERASPVFILPHVSLGQEYYPNPVGYSGTVTATLWLTNNLRGAAAQVITNVVVTYQLPSDFVYLGVVEGTPTPTIIGANYVWNNITIPASGSTAIRFRLQAPFKSLNYSAYNAWARSIPRPDICIPRSKPIPALSVKPGVILTKKPNPNSVGPYGLVEYTLEAENQTGAPLSKVRITDTLPYGFQYIQHVSGPPPISTSPPVWEVDLGPAGTSQAKVAIKFQARAFTLVGYWYNLVDGFYPGALVTRTSGYDDQVKLYVASGIGLFKTVVPTRTVAGGPVVYTITFFNGSDTAIRNVRLTDTLPTGFTYAGMITGPSPVMTSPLVWAFPGSIARGTEIKIAFQATTDAQMPRGFYYNRVTGYAEKAVSPYDPVVVPDTGETAPVYVQGLPTVERTKVVTPENVMAGERVTYTIYLYNEDTETDRTVRLTDTLPPSVTFVAVVDSTPAPVITAPLVWQLSVGAGQTVTLQFVAEVDYLARSGTYYNRLDALVDGRALPPLPQLAPLNVTEIPRLDVQVSVDDGRLWVSAGDLLTYTIIVTNRNSAGVTVEDVVLTATLEPSDYLTVTGEGWTEVSPGVFTYTVGAVAAEGAISVPLYAEIHPVVPSEYMTVGAGVEATYRTAMPVIEEDWANNRAVDVDILRGPDLVVTGVTWEPAQPAAGRPITFYVTVKNQGTEAITRRWDGSGQGEHWLFVLELYAKGPGLSATPPVDVFDHIGGYCADATCSTTRYEFLGWATGLQANEERTIPFVVTLPEGTYHLYAQVDVTWPGNSPWGQPFGLIREAIEDNNVYNVGQVTLQRPVRYVYLPLVLRNR